MSSISSETYAQADKVRADASRGHFFGASVGCASCWQGEWPSSIGVTDIGEMAEELQMVNKALSGLDAALRCRKPRMAPTPGRYFLDSS